MEMNPDISDTTIQRTLAELLKCGEIEKNWRRPLHKIRVEIGGLNDYR